MPKPPENTRAILAFTAGWISATLFAAFMASSVSGTAAIAASAIAMALFLTAGFAYSQFVKRELKPVRQRQREQQLQSHPNPQPLPQPPCPELKPSQQPAQQSLQQLRCQSPQQPEQWQPQPAQQPAPAPTPTLDQRCEAYAQTHGLTPRQGEVLRLLADGLPAGAIAEELYLSKDTIKTHTKAIYAKAGVHSRQELLAALYSQKG